MSSRSFLIFCDVTCDLSEELRTEYEIDYIPGRVTFADGVDRAGVLDWSAYPLSVNEFCDALRKDPSSFKTATPRLSDFFDAFRKAWDQKKGILLICLSSGMSSTYQYALNAKTAFLEEYPDAVIEVVDSLRYGLGMGMMAIEASMRRAEGMDLKATAEWLMVNRNAFHQAGWLDDLTFLAKMKRINNAAAFFGTLIGIKPIGEFAENGMTTVMVKVKGEKAAFPVLVEYLRQTIVDPEEAVLCIAFSSRRKQAEAYRDMIEEALHPKKIYLCEQYPSTITNIGPGLMACYYLGKPISRDLIDETKLINEIAEANK